MDPRPVRLDLYRTAIPMRGFEHAAARRDVAEAIVVRVELSDGAAGWGETLPREYVTGETLESVPADIEGLLWPAALAGDRRGKSLPVTDSGGRPVTAARCAVELALDAAWRAFRRRRPRVERESRPFPRLRVSGVLGSADPSRTARRLRLMRWYGLRDFKLKLGFGDEVDAENLRVVRKRIGKAVAAGRCTLRADVNGGWSPDDTPDRAAGLIEHGVCVVEQPVFAPAEALAALAGRCRLPLMADESLVTADDADRLIRGGEGNVWLNVRLSKNGGLWPTLGIVEAAAEAGTPLVVGCMVGESSLLADAQRRLLQRCPLPRFVEGNYGRFLLAGDLTGRSVRFRWGGRLPGPSDPPVAPDPRRLARYARRVKTLEA